MILVIRMRGRVDVNKDIKATLDRLRLKTKFVAVLVPANKEIQGMLTKVRQFVSYGKIDKETLRELILKRGRKEGDKPVKEIEGKALEDLMEGKTKLISLGIKPFFRLHPPVGGIKNSRLAYPIGILGENPKITELIRRMI